MGLPLHYIPNQHFSNLMVSRKIRLELKPMSTNSIGQLGNQGGPDRTEKTNLGDTHLTH